MLVSDVETGPTFISEGPSGNMAPRHPQATQNEIEHFERTMRTSLHTYSVRH